MDIIRHLIFNGLDKNELELVQQIKDAVRKMYNYSMEHCFNEEGLQNIQSIHQNCLEALEGHYYQHANVCINLMICVNRQQEALRCHAIASLRIQINLKAEEKISAALCGVDLLKIGTQTKRCTGPFEDTDMEYIILQETLEALTRL